MTNYTIAQSHNEAEWIAYIEEKDKPILNPDEYGKTVLDYAIMFGNYNFLKFLINKNYIWFDSRKDIDYVMTFGAGTNIQRIKFEEHDNGLFNLMREQMIIAFPLACSIKIMNIYRQMFMSIAEQGTHFP